MALLAVAASQPKASSQEEEPGVTSDLVRCDLSGMEQVEQAPILDTWIVQRVL